MRAPRWRWPPFLVALLVGWTGATRGAPAQVPLALRGATVIDGTGAPPVPDATVVIRGDRIVAVGPAGAVRVPAEAHVLDLAGRYLIPGLIDAHAHVTVLRWVRDERGALRGEYDRALSERVLRVLLQHGITTVRNPLAPTAEGVALRDAVARGAVPGPRIVTAGDALTDGRATEEEIREEVRRQARAGVDLIKVYAQLPPHLVRAAIAEARTHGIPVLGHLQRTTWTDAARMGIGAITHGAPWSPEYLPEDRRAAYRQTMLGRLDWLEWLDLDGPEVSQTIRELVDRRIPLDPTLIALHTKFFGDDPRHTGNPEQRLAPEIAEEWRSAGTPVDDWTPADFARARRLWPKLEALIRRYHRAGVLLAAGSDLPNPWVIPGVALHQELQLLVECGIPPLEAITIATRNGAEALGLLSEVGTLEPGKRADLVILSSDPTADIRNTRSIEAVIQGGRVIPSSGSIR